MKFQAAPGGPAREIDREANNLHSASDRDMKHKISDGSSIYGSTSQPSLLRPRSIPSNGDGDGKRPVPEGYSPGFEADEVGGGGEAEIPLEKQVGGEDTAYPAEVNDKEMESYDEGDDGEEEEEEEEAAMEEEVLLLEASEGDKAKLAEGFYEVEAIRRKRICKGEPQFLIKWRGWPESSNTWEPLEHLQSCPDVVEAYEQSLNSGKKTRKRKRKYTQPKKKLQFSYATPGARDVKTSKRGRKPSVQKPSHEPSEALESRETNDDEDYSDKDNDTGKIAEQSQEPAKADGSSVNSSSKADTAEQSQGDRRVGAKRRKPSTVQRFRPDIPPSDPNDAANSTPANGSYDTAEQLMMANIDPYPIKFDFAGNKVTVTKILKPIRYSTYKSNGAEEILLSFVVLRSDGIEVVVDNKFLKHNYPHVLIEFYEKHLTYNRAD